ncbi:MAG: hypothetical protein PHQ60_06635 [Sideroxydans sp.]|nr:hypothetical protein [Sideroxydans sp.]
MKSNLKEVFDMNFHCPRFFYRTLFLVSILLSIGGCGGGGGGTGGGGTSIAPTFNGVAVAIPSAAGGEVTLSWDAATDDVTASSAIVYDISVATTAGAPFAATYSTAAGATSYTVTGLADDTDYFFVVRARDEAGNRDTNTVEALTHELIGTMNLRGTPMAGIPGAIAFTYRDANCNTFTLYFGDESFDEQNCPGDGGDVTVNHQFTQAGTYHVSLSNLQGETSDDITFTITPAAAIGVVLNDVIIGAGATSGGAWYDPNSTYAYFLPTVLGATVSVADIESRLAAGKSVAISTVNLSSDLIVNDAVSWSANSLTLNSMRDIKINAVMSASGTASLNFIHGLSAGNIKMGFNADGTFKGRVDFPGRSGTGLLTINGNPYTVINSLGLEGSLTTTDLQGMNGNLAGNYALGSDIDASATSGWNALAGFQPVGYGGTTPAYFTGNFDGLGHTVSGLAINRSADMYVGLFGLASSLNIANVGVVNAAVSGNTYVGGLVGYMSGGATHHSYSSGSVSGASRVGGLIGENDAGGVISNSHSACSVSGTVLVGGLTGINFNSTVSDSYSTGTASGGDMVGGLTGNNGGTSSTISRSYSSGNVTGTGSYIGGLVGRNDLTIGDSYSTGSVTGISYVGGLVGYNGAGFIGNTYSTGSVSGTASVGGLVGFWGGGISSNSYWNTETSGQAASAAGAGLTTSQMKAQANFTSWDFVSTWSIVEGVSYPTLQIF